MTDFQHLTVLCDETVDAVLTNTAGCYIDATFGRGGHTRKLLAALGPQARVIAFDKDPLAIATGEALAKADPRFSIVHDSFASMKAHVSRLGLQGQVAGVLADLGVSPPQIDDG